MTTGREMQSPFSEGPYRKESPFVDNRRIIRITSSNRANVVGEEIYYNHHGVEIYAPKDCVIVIHPVKDEIHIERNKVLRAPEDRQYIILEKVYSDDDPGEDCRYHIVQGRQNAFDLLVDLSEFLDLRESYILVDTVSMEDMVNCYEFLIGCIDNDLVDNPDGFDPRELD